MQLFDYQQEGVRFLALNKRAYIALDMGMGKTITSIAAVRALAKKNVLLIAEKTEIVNAQNFKKEVEAHFPDLGYVSLRDVAIENVPEGRHVCGINPDALVKLDIREIKKKFDAAIIDEATLAKNTTTQRFKKTMRICRELEYLALLSGTPMMNGAAEIFAPLVLMGHWLGGDGGKASRQAFEKIFAGGFEKQMKKLPDGASRADFYRWPLVRDRWKYFAWWAKGANHLRELRWIARDAFMIMRKSESSAFKKKERKMELVPMTAEWIAEYDQAWDDYIASVKEHNRRADPDKIKSLENISELQKVIENGQIYQVNSRWKAKRVARDIAEGKYGDRRIVVFSLFMETDAIVQEELAALGVSFRTFEEMREWKAGDERVIVGRIRSHAKGANLPEASAVLFVDMDFVPANNLQAENRIDRPEQQRDMVVCYYLTEQKTVDQHVRKIVADKMRKIEEFMRPFTDEEAQDMPAKVRELIGKHEAEFRTLKRCHDAG